MKQTTLGYIEFENKYLMLCRDIDKHDGSLDKWIGIGGKLEPKEDADACFIREVFEETGITLAKSEIKRRGIVDFKSEKYPDERMFLYTAKVANDYFNPDCNEGTLKWIDKNDILSLNLWEGDIVFLKRILNLDITRIENESNILKSKESFFVLSLIYGGTTGEELVEVQEDKLVHTDITSLEDDKLYLYTSLNENNLRRVYEPAEGVFIAETPVVIERAVYNNYKPESFLCEHRLLFDLAKYAYLDVPIFSSSSETLCDLTGYGLTHGMLSVMRRKKLMTLEEIICDKNTNQPVESDNKNDVKKIAVLEDVMNPANTGAIVRSAAALGVDAMIITKGASDPLYRRAIRVSMGNIFDMPYTRVKDYKWVDTLKENGFKIVSMALSEDSHNINDSEIKRLKDEKLAICFGTESTGISDELLQKSDYVVKIPMSKNVDSLNVAAASAVTFFALCIQ